LHEEVVSAANERIAAADSPSAAAEAAPKSVGDERALPSLPQAPSSNEAAAKRQQAPAARIYEVAGVSASAKIIGFEQGLYAVTIGPADQRSRLDLIMELPSTQISGLGRDGGDRPRIFEAMRSPGAWLGPDGGTIVAEVPPSGGHLLITTYRDSGKEPTAVAIQVSRLDRPAPAAVGRSPESPAAVPQSAPDRSRELELEIIVHVERHGAQRYGSGEWAGQRGLKRKLVAFSIRPLSTLAPADIEYKAYGPNGRETPWVSGPTLCGAKESSVPLTGFAVRVAPHRQSQFAVRYEGAFFEGGILAGRAGHACVSPRFEDPLEALKVSIVDASPK
jgi:hypothetical protein